MAYILFVLFLTLKLAGAIDWSWWIVTLPLWIGLAISGGIALIGGATVGLVAGVRALFRR